MRTYISDSRFDSRLRVNTSSINPSAELLLIVRIAMHEYLPGGGLDEMLGIRGGRALAYEHDDDRVIVMRPWPAGEFQPFCRNFKTTVQDGWSNKLWLVPARPWGPSVTAKGSGKQVVPTVACRLRIDIVTSDQHVDADVVYLAPDSDFRRSTAPTRRWRPRWMCWQGTPGRLKLDNNVLIEQEGYRQIVALHEMGHYLGLDHVNGRGGEDENYGRNEFEKNSLMGRGAEIRPPHAWPWKTRLMLHINTEPDAWHAIVQPIRSRAFLPVPEPSPGPSHSDEHGAPLPDGGVASLNVSGRFQRPGTLG